MVTVVDVVISGILRWLNPATLLASFCKAISLDIFASNIRYPSLPVDCQHPDAHRGVLVSLRFPGRRSHLPTCQIKLGSHGTQQLWE